MKLAKFEEKVFVEIVRGQYSGETGFSDVIPEDIYKNLGCSPKAVGGALSSLDKKGLVFVEDLSGQLDNGIRTIIYLTTKAWKMVGVTDEEIGNGYYDRETIGKFMRSAIEKGIVAE